MKSPKTQGLLIAALFVFAFVMDSFFGTTTSQQVVMAGGGFNLMIAGGVVFIVSVTGIVVCRVGKTSDPDIKSKTKKAFERLRGER